MSRRLPVSLVLAVSLLLASSPSLLPAQPKHEKSVWNYDGGLLLLTDGSLPSGPCFRLNGRATAPGYFDNLKRVETYTDTFFHRGNEIVTEFPPMLHVSFLMYDFPCDDRLNSTAPRVYLTHAAVSTLRLSFYWKHVLKLRPATGIIPGHFETRPILPYASESVPELPRKFEWLFEFDIPSAGVPVTDSLVVILRTPDGHIAARAAARM